jgi:hypothetical protein
MLGIRIHAAVLLGRQLAPPVIPSSRCYGDSWPATSQARCLETRVACHVPWCRVSRALVSRVTCLGVVCHVPWCRLSRALVSRALVSRVTCHGVTCHVPWCRVSWCHVSRALVSRAQSLRASDQPAGWVSAASRLLPMGGTHSSLRTVPSRFVKTKVESHQDSAIS